MKVHQKSYEVQRDHMNRDCFDQSRKAIHESWFRKDTVDFWRHDRMYRTISPIATHFKGQTWLTIGDGRFGLDSIKLHDLFGIRAFPTDISENMLQVAKAEGLITDYSVENGEKLSFDDHQFDIVFCKEALHHFPRPTIALYEMLRVSKLAVILIEPNDRFVLNPLGTFFRQCCKMLFKALFSRKPTVWRHWFFADPLHCYETIGNYVFALSRRELEKIAHAEVLGGYAWKGFNDCYEAGVEFEKDSPSSAMGARIRRTISEADSRCLKWPLFFDWIMNTSVLFHQDPPPALREEMEIHGFSFANILKNPAIK